MPPYYSAAPLLGSGELIELMPDYRPQSMGIYGIYTSRRQMPATLRTMLDFWWSGLPTIRIGRRRCADSVNTRVTFLHIFHHQRIQPVSEPGMAFCAQRPFCHWFLRGIACYFCNVKSVNKT
ncbi:hypothetical protein D3C72_2079740 [compost metagenome]